MDLKVFFVSDGTQTTHPGFLGEIFLPNLLHHVRVGAGKDGFLQVFFNVDGREKTAENDD